MKNIEVKVSVYQNFSVNKGDYPLLQILSQIRAGRWSEKVNNLREALEAGDDDRADRIKKSLPAFTVSATYKGARKASNLTAYTGIIILDIDHLEADEVDPLSWKAADCPHTLFCFRSPGGRGLKIGVDPRRLIDHALTADNHLPTYTLVCSFYQQLLGVTIDPSGKDIGRLCFVSYDKECFIREPFDARDGESNPQPGAGPCQLQQCDIKNSTEEPCNQKDEQPKETDPSSVVAEEATKKKLFKILGQVRRATNRRMQFVKGNRNNYIYLFAHLCSSKGITQEDALVYCLRNLKGLNETEYRNAIKSAYGAKEKQDAEKDEVNTSKIGVRQIEGYLHKFYKLRHNLITRQVEWKRKNARGDYELLDEIMLNTIWCDIVNGGIKCRPSTLQSVLYSNFVPRYDPFIDYFKSLPDWDGETDHIARLADTVTTTRQDYWRDCFKRWIVAMVGCAIIPEVINHTVLVLNGAQGVGKTTWCCNLVPPGLRSYLHSGPADPRSKDIRLALTSCLLINLDELGALREQELNSLKEMITATYIRERRAYARDPESLTRKCSFTASVNSGQVINDVTGSRRFLCFDTLKIDFKTPVDYEKVFAQAVFLLENGFKYWFDGADIELINANNEPYRIQLPEEELFNTYFRLPVKTDTEILLLSSAQIMQHLAMKASIQITRQATLNISMILKNQGFTQIRSQNRRLYKVVKLDEEEVDRRKKHVWLKDQNLTKDNDNQIDISF